VIVTGHTHDATPHALEVDGTLLMSSGSHGKYLGRIDLEVKDGKVAGYSSNLIPVFSDVITPDPEMAAKIDEVRAPYEAETQPRDRPDRQPALPARQFQRDLG
jgi:sulfur-oxidizing protein SoxB